MARDAAIVTRWATSKPGREKAAIECFMDFLTMLGKQAAEGKCSEPEAYFTYDGRGGMGIVRGKSDVLMNLWESDEFREIITRAQLTVDGISTEMYESGESVQDSVGLFNEVAAKLGYM